MKTKEELNALREEVETLSNKLHALSEEELEQVVGGDIRSMKQKLLQNEFPFFDIIGHNGWLDQG